ncbi:hypothetical protein [Brevibacillus nitrificans]|uniref:hypothetical protein n=1 Tax=Brevibacillus nitrificans TaxID=651560 RepID=UPI00285F912F|nr:hypothetical protein [Brevibacillus nitrificans]MDR7316872.1 hypothetical protein [Brevibacillus nitrificans]
MRVLLCVEPIWCPLLHNHHLTRMALWTPAGMQALIFLAVGVAIIHLRIIDFPIRTVVTVKVVQPSRIIQAMSTPGARLLQGNQTIANRAEMVHEILLEKKIGLFLLCAGSWGSMQAFLSHTAKKRGDLLPRSF